MVSGEIFTRYPRGEAAASTVETVTVPAEEVGVFVTAETCCVARGIPLPGAPGPWSDAPRC